MRDRTRFLGSVVAAAALVALVLPGSASAHRRSKSVSVEFTAKRPGEALLDVRALAPETDWQRAGKASAVVRLALDGAYNEDVVLFAGARPFDYKVALGRVGRGRHKVRARFDRAKSPAGATRARILSLTPSFGPSRGDEALAQRYSPVVYGRDLPEIPGGYENNRTDGPLLTYHEVSHGSDGGAVLQYTVIWSNEDGGTNTPARMARWGRTTDIEWIYRVALDAQGKVVSEVYQASNHETRPFTGARLGDHPMLETATANNNMVRSTIPPRRPATASSRTRARRSPPAARAKP